MNEYHKIQSVYKRDPATKYKTFLIGDYSFPEFGYLENLEWEFTEKVDGTNIRIMYDADTRKASYGGKTNRAQIPADLFNYLGDNYPSEIFHSNFEDSVTFYGEGYGAKIQKGGGRYSDAQKFVLFDIKIGSWWLKRDVVISIAEALNMDVVPVIGHGTLESMVSITRQGFCSNWGDFLAEGIVARPKVDLFTRTGYRIITKVKHKDFTHEK